MRLRNEATASPHLRRVAALVQQPDAADEAGASDEASPLIRVLDRRRRMEHLTPRRSYKAWLSSDLEAK